MNIPIFYLGFVSSIGYMLRSLVGILSFAFSVLLGTAQQPDKPVVDDLLLSALFGGALNGIGYGLIFRGRGSAGGTDIIALVLNRTYSFSLGSSGFVLNAIPLFIGILLFDIKLIGYTLIAMYLSSRLIDKVQLGFITSKTITIVSSRHEELAQAIMQRIGKASLYCRAREHSAAATPRYCHHCVFDSSRQAKDIVAELDPGAFMTVTDTSEVLGKGFAEVQKTTCRLQQAVVALLPTDLPEVCSSHPPSAPWGDLPKRSRGHALLCNGFDVLFN